MAMLRTKGAWTMDGEKSSLKIKPVRSKEEQDGWEPWMCIADDNILGEPSHS